MTNRFDYQTEPASERFTSAKQMWITVLVVVGVLAALYFLVRPSADHFENQRRNIIHNAYRHPEIVEKCGRVETAFILPLPREEKPLPHRTYRNWNRVETNGFVDGCAQVYIAGREADLRVNIHYTYVLRTETFTIDWIEMLSEHENPTF